jgi:heme A synthase
MKLLSDGSLEFALMLGYAVSLAIIAVVLEWAARYAARRSHKVSTAGFTYHQERDVWRCPQDQHLFPIFSDSLKGVVVYRAPASACNSCHSKAACTDSGEGRQIERRNFDSVELGMQRFHRVLSVTLFVLASLILVIELFRTSALYPRIALLATLIVFYKMIERLCSSFREARMAA